MKTLITHKADIEKIKIQSNNVLDATAAIIAYLTTELQTF